MAESGDTTVIAAEAQIKGELVFEGQARIIGKVEGKIKTTGDLHVEERGECKAQVEANNVQVDGTIEGDVTASQRVQLNAQGKIQGDIVAVKMVTAEGATIVGHVNVGAGATGDLRTADRPSTKAPAATPKATEAPRPAAKTGEPAKSAQPVTVK